MFFMSWSRLVSHFLIYFVLTFSLSFKTPTSPLWFPTCLISLSRPDCWGVGTAALESVFHLYFSSINIFCEIPEPCIWVLSFVSKVVTERGTETNCFGVQRTCLSSENLERFHVTTRYPSDLRHSLFESIAPSEVALCLDLSDTFQSWWKCEFNTIPSISCGWLHTSGGALA